MPFSYSNNKQTSSHRNHPSDTDKHQILRRHIVRRQSDRTPSAPDATVLRIHASSLNTATASRSGPHLQAGGTPGQTNHAGAHHGHARSHPPGTAACFRTRRSRQKPPRCPAHPGTQQNHIHDQQRPNGIMPKTRRPGDEPPTPNPAMTRQPPSRQRSDLGTPRDQTSARHAENAPTPQTRDIPGPNPGDDRDRTDDPPACKAGALPAELRPLTQTRRHPPVVIYQGVIHQWSAASGQTDLSDGRSPTTDT